MINTIILLWAENCTI